MSQTYQTLSKEGSQTKLETLLLENQAVQFVMATVAQELNHLSDTLSAPLLSVATYEFILKSLRNIRTTQVKAQLQAVFTA